MINSKQVIKFSNFKTWFNVLNLVTLLPVIIWPVVFFMSIFAMDDPNHEARGLAIFIGLNSYPLVLLLLVLLSRYFYLRKRIIGIGINFINLLLIILVAFFIVGLFLD